MYKSKGVLVAFGLIAVLIISSAIYSYAATNTMPATSTLGEGSTTISGYVVSDIQYSLNTINPGDIDQVSFTLDNLANTVKIKLVASGSSFYDCGLTAGRWECDTTIPPQATVILADEITVIAGQ